MPNRSHIPAAQRSLVCLSQFTQKLRIKLNARGVRYSSSTNTSNFPARTASSRTPWSRSL